MGVKAIYEGDAIHLQCEKLQGTQFCFSKKTHTGTEALILAAVKAEGRTVIENAGQEPEIDDLISYLNKMGAKVTRQPLDKIVIDGVKQLKGAIHQVMPDRNEAVSYAVAALATKGDIVVENAKEEHLKAFLQKIDEIGAEFSVSDYGIRFWYQRALKATDVKTAPEPGFMTDWQPLWTVLMTQAQGESHVIESVFDNRLQYIHQLNQMGASITLYQPSVEDPASFYEFDVTQQFASAHAAKILGPTSLSGTELTVPDLRAGATLTIAALIAQGRTTLHGIEHIERGYEDLDGRLRQLGANIQKVSDEEFLKGGDQENQIFIERVAP